MTIDKQKLKALAEAARDYSGSDLIEHESRYNALACEVDPVTVLTLLAEIERHEAWRTAFLAERDAQMRQRDQLRAENEALRKDAERYRAIRDEIPHADLGRAILDVQTADEYDAAVDAAMAKEKSHD
ncbi:hypothetical protein [Pseudomonas sp. NBRC 111126]|uniref:hypothetical protein n=1 Tax=Pseudomonas sp. NBRC 111126 TaxID=1661041 RepID=UPI0008635D59|nr:hypothetical protein [Pseudomonas sp. NBRC 111126]